MINRVTLIGRLVKEPESRETTNSTVCNFTVVTSEYSNKDGEKKEHAEFHRVVAWGRLAEICGEYLEKGKLVYIEGSLRTRSYEDKDGVKKYTTEVVARTMQMLDSKKKDDSIPETEDDHYTKDDIPF